MKYYAIIVAGGSGNRMETSIAKQFLLLNKIPLLMHTLNAFNKCVLNPEILLVLNIHHHQYWEELCAQYKFKVPHRVIKGGAQRFDSVKNGLKYVKGNGIVAVHDAVRPLVSPDLIFSSYEVAEELGSAVAGIHPTDSVRKIINEEKSKALKRDLVLLIQTPQTFEVKLLRKAYQQPYRNEFTDDASVVEFAGYKINVIPGERSNIKITYPDDLNIASFILNKKGF